MSVRWSDNHESPRNQKREEFNGNEFQQMASVVKFFGFFFSFLLLFWVGLRLGLNSTCEVKLNTIVFIETNYTTAA
jgi:hypothetical protein